MPAFTSKVPVAGNASYLSANFPPVAVGTYRWIASYGGDAANAASATACNDANESVIVSAATVPPSSIPALSQTALMILMLLLVALGARRIRNR